jgi:hypothetical protein
MKRSSSFVLGAALVLLTAWQSAVAAPIFMPPGSTVWMKLTSNACDDADLDNCAGSNQPGPAPPNGIPLANFGNPLNPAAGFAEVLPDRVRSFIAGGSGTFIYASFEDTYTVEGTAVGEFPITVHLDVTGEGRSRLSGSNHILSGATVIVAIGTFNPASEFEPGRPLLEQFRIAPFNTPTGPSRAGQGPPTMVSGTPITFPFDVGTSYTQMVRVGDVFDIGYQVRSSIAVGEVDLRDTAMVSFDLPVGVTLRSALAESLIPEPGGLLLLASGWTIAVAGSARRRRVGTK